MKIITAKWIFDGEALLADHAVAFGKRIEAVGPAKELKKLFCDAETIDLSENELLLPGLINPHLHLEFGANTTHLRYGDFMSWLESVISHRDELVEACRAGCYKRQIDGMLHTGVTSFGTVSSYGRDMKACAAAPQRVVYFNEAIGSQPAAVDALYADFMSRLEESEKLASERFLPAVAIHSPYSVHPILIKKILSHIGERALSAHFMESPAEREWLTKGEGDFKPFFENFLKQSSPLCFPEEFLQLLDGKRCQLTHAVWADEQLLQMISKAGHGITHCPRSNRYLGCGRLEIERLEEFEIEWSLGTDGLSSNNTLSMWDEMRAALMMHSSQDPNDLAVDLLAASTSRAAKALGISAGKIAKGRYADMITVRLPHTIEREEDFAMQLILHTEKAQSVIIGGEEIRLDR